MMMVMTMMVNNDNSNDDDGTKTLIITEREFEAQSVLGHLISKFNASKGTNYICGFCDCCSELLRILSAKAFATCSSHSSKAVTSPGWKSIGFNSTIPIFERMYAEHRSRRWPSC